MTARPIAYVMEQTLGNVTHYLNLRRAESMCQAPGIRWLPIEYQLGVLPFTVNGGWLARSALDALLPEVDGVFIHTITLALLSFDRFRDKPTVLSADGTPLNKRHMREAYGLQPQGNLREHAQRALYSKVYGRAAGLVAWSNWAKRSFVTDYTCREQDVAVIPPGVDLSEFKAGNRDHELPRILFVGGDFERKGGELLLEVFRARFRGRAELILVTRGNVRAEPGVEVHRELQPNSAKLRELYASSDIFVMPTFADCFSIVAIEALAAGLPVVVTRVGGIPDIVVDGETGHLLEPGDSATLGNRLESLIVDPARRRAMSEKARADAVRRFDALENARRLFEFVRSRC